MYTLWKTTTKQPRHRVAVVAAIVAMGAFTAIAGGCGSDDQGETGAAATTNAPPAAAVDAALLSEAVAGYERYVANQVDLMRERTTAFTDAVRAGDLKAARAAYAPSRAPWERIEPIAGLVEEIDGAVDARVDDFAGPEDPEFTGWHRLELLLFARDTTEGPRRSPPCWTRISPPSRPSCRTSRSPRW